MQHGRVLLDLFTQRDFFSREGSCYSVASGRAARNVRRMFRWSRSESIPVISTLLRTRCGEPSPMAAVPHCVDGTWGEGKLRGTVLPRHINFGLRNIAHLMPDVFESYQQAIFEMRHTDIFSHRRIERLLTELDGATFFLLGAGVAHGIFQAAMGLRARKAAVVLARDAVAALPDPAAGPRAIRLDAKGVVFATTAEIIAPRPHARPRHRLRRKQPI